MLIHIKRTALRLLCCCLLTTGSIYAVETQTQESTQATTQATTHTTLPNKATNKQVTAKKGATKPASLAEQATGQLDIIGTVDAPMQSNILSWQDIDSKAPKTEIEFSALKDALTPTDRDRLTNEVRYSKILNQPEK